MYGGDSFNGALAGATICYSDDHGKTCERHPCMALLMPVLCSER